MSGSSWAVGVGLLAVAPARGALVSLTIDVAVHLMFTTPMGGKREKLEADE